MKRALVCGAGGFLGHHMVKRLKAEGYFVRGVDRRKSEFESSAADEFVVADLRTPHAFVYITPGAFDEVYQFAANMGGMGFLGDPGNDAAVLHDNAAINLNVLEACRRIGKQPKVYFSSSACVYPEEKVWWTDPGITCFTTKFRESDAYPAQPDLEYGFEKLFSERLYQAYGRAGVIDPRIGRHHNVYGPLGTWDGGREKAPAAICRKVAQAKLSHWPEIEVWGDGEQRRSFCYVDDAIEGVRRLMQADSLTVGGQAINIGSSEMVTVNRLVDLVCIAADVTLEKKHVPGPEGVRARNSDNTLIQEKLGWEPLTPLTQGLAETYAWIEKQVRMTLMPKANAG